VTPVDRSPGSSNAVLRLGVGGEGIRATHRLVGVDRKTVRRYVEVALELGLLRDE
jgi:hypothetical protein